MLLNQRKKISIFNFRTVPRRDITILSRDWKRFAARPIEQFLPRAFTGKNPENFFGPLTLQLLEQVFQIFETGNALDVFMLQQTPRTHHQPAVSNRQIRRKYGAPVRLIFAQSREASARRSHDKSSTLRYPRNCFFNIAVEKLDTENLANGESANVRHRKLRQETVVGSISSTAGK